MSPGMNSTVPRVAPKVIEMAPEFAFDLDALPAGIRAALEETALQKSYSAARFAPKDASDLRELASEWYDSDLLPEAYYPDWSDKTGKPNVYSADDLRHWRKRGISRATIVMRYGAALGVLPEMAIRLIYIIDGQPSPAAALMLAIFLSSPVCAIFEPGESTALIAKMRVGRKGQKAFEVSATYVEYKHLHSRKNWVNYPTDLVYARCLGRAMRRVAPDLFAGVYCAEERQDFRADRAAGVAEDPLARLSEMVDMDPRSPLFVHDLEAPPIAHAPIEETTQGPPVATPAINATQYQQELNALGLRIKDASDSTTPEEVEKLRADVEAVRFVSVIAYNALVKKWEANEPLRPYVVAR